MTADLVQRVARHREGAIDGFTRQYDGRFLVYYKEHEDMLEALARENAIKAGSRRKALALIEGMNPHSSVLYPTIV